MSPPELEQYLHAHIPLSAAMRVSVVSVQQDNVVLRAPLAPNINHRETVFGGSASAVAILAAWSLLHTRMQRAGIQSRLVIQRNTMRYELPIAGTFTAHASITQPQAWQPFLRLLARGRKARISIASVLFFDGQTAGHFEGEFVALPGNDA
jgi:thioesterase domain-containing protein